MVKERSAKEEFYFVTGGGGLCLLACCCCLCCLLVICCVIFIPSGIRTIRYDQYGLFLDTVTRKVDQKGYEPGRYLRTISTETITLPATYKTLTFIESNGNTLTSRTRDGLPINLDVSYQYRINSTENVLWIFNKFAKNYEKTVIQISSDVMRDVAADYNAADFFTKRKEIGTALFQRLRSSMASIRIEVGYLQLRNVNLPDSYESIIERNEILRQEIIMVQYDQQSSVIDAQTEVIKAQKEAQILEIQGRAEAEASILEAKAAANRTLETVSAYANHYQKLINDMSFNHEQVVSYSFVDMIRDHDSSKLVLNLDKPSTLSL